MHKIAVLAVCFLLAATVLPGASKAAKKQTASSAKKPAAKRASSSTAAKETHSAKPSPASRKTGAKSTASKGKTAASPKSGSGKRSVRAASRTTSRSRRGRSASRTKGSGGFPAAGASVTPRSSAQRLPSAERYREIQQALADRGYYQGAVSGEWGPESVDALKRFQREQNLSPNGKLDSLSLISLGLGPKRDPNALGGPGTTTSSAPSPATTSQKEPSQP